MLWPVPLLTPTSTPTSGDPFMVQSPLGFLAPDGTVMPTVAKPYYVIVTDGAGSWLGNCRLVKVTGATTPPDAQGGVTLTFDVTASRHVQRRRGGERARDHPRSGGPGDPHAL